MNRNTSLKLCITHSTRYEFEGPVFFEPHSLRFKPAPNSHVHVEKYGLDVDPTPTGMAEILDPEGNGVQFCWFDGTYTALNLKSVSVIEVSEFNPFHFLIHPAECITSPFAYDDLSLRVLAPYMEKIDVEATLVDLGRQILKQSQYNTFAFLKNLNEHVFEKFSVNYREKGAPLSPDSTFKNKAGSCRDLSWMLIQLLRNLGYAARFTSGYFYLEQDSNEFDLHAWFDVYVPGAGWVGFDPSHGILAGARHIPICSSALPENTLPVSGNIRGKFQSTIQSKVTIDVR